jgi:hypothetical protein
VQVQVLIVECVSHFHPPELLSALRYAVSLVSPTSTWLGTSRNVIVPSHKEDKVMKGSRAWLRSKKTSKVVCVCGGVCVVWGVCVCF